MTTLLEKMRKINVQLVKSNIMDYDVLAKLLSEVLNADIFIIKEGGVMVGSAGVASNKCNYIFESVSKAKKENNDVYIHYTPIKVPVINKHYYENDECTVRNSQCPYGERVRCMWPIYVNGNNVGLFVVGRIGSEGFSEEDIVICEHAITCVSLVAMHVIQKNEAEEERKRQMIRVGFDTLSYSEMEAIGHILKSLDGKEGLLVASKIADKAGITRSVIVNALRKLESAGLIETRSLGMKGTFIKIKNEFIFDELRI